MGRFWKFIFILHFLLQANTLKETTMVEERNFESVDITIAKMYSFGKI